MHLPVQHGSDAVLQGMNRGYTIEHYRDLVDYIRKQILAVVLTTDLIVGFRETEEMHRETLALLQDIRYDMAYTSFFSAFRHAGDPHDGQQSRRKMPRGACRN